MSISLKADPSGTFGEILVNGQVVAKLPVSGNAVIPGLVGAVSQSGGVPTGAIIERGSNANGEYVRFADGTQICVRQYLTGSIAITSSKGSLFSGAVITWTYPATFISDSVAPAFDLSGTEVAVFATRGGPLSNTSTQIMPLSPTSLTQDNRATWLAIGRWY